jgi:hypothetical protein
MKEGKIKTTTRLSHQNDINRTQSQCHPRNLPSRQGRQTQEHTIHPQRKQVGGTP